MNGDKLQGIKCIGLSTNVRFQKKQIDANQFSEISISITHIIVQCEEFNIHLFGFRIKNMKHKID